MKHAAAGVDILVVSGTEAGGHCGEVSTMVVVPDVLDAIQDYPEIDVLAAGRHQHRCWMISRAW